jgi:predicted methyltransferase
MAHFVYRHNQKLVEVNNHKMFLGDCSLPTLACINSFVHDQYEPETSALMKRIIREGMTVFDLGAHVGYYTLLAAEQVGVTGHVFAFEPDPENYAVLIKNVELNGYKNVTFINMAISDMSGIETF